MPHLQATTSQLTMLNPAGLYNPAANGYSHAVKVSGQGNWVFVSGQGGEDENGVLPPEFELQLQQSLANLVTALAAADAELHHIAQLTILVVGHNEQRLALISQTINTAWAGRPTPACTLIPVPRLALDGMLIEIGAVAIIAVSEVIPA